MKFKGKNITVMGLGTHGGNEGLVRYLAENQAKVLVTDLKSASELKATLDNLKDLKGIEYHLGGHKWSDFASADMVFLNPAVPKKSLWVKKILKAKIPISSEMNLFFDNCQGQIIGVTGTNGKSTTSNLIFEILKNKFQPIHSLETLESDISSDKRKIFFGGNIGGSLLKYLDKITAKDVVLLELSSFQLYDFSKIKKSPHIAIILNITPDHLDTHSDFKEYVEAKKNIVRFQNDKDFAILNYDAEIVRKIAKGTSAKILFFSTKRDLSRGAFIENQEILVNFRGKKSWIMPTKEIKLLGLHNLENILAATLVGILYGIQPEKIRKTIANFRGLSHRLEYVDEIKGIKYYNDSKSTTPESTIAALNCFEKPLMVICGGKEKGFNFSNLAKHLLRKAKHLFLIGECAKMIEKAVNEQAAKNSEGRILEGVYNVKTLKNALRKIKTLAQEGDIVLFSPATSSYDQFSNFEERGQMFKKMIRKEISND